MARDFNGSTDRIDYTSVIDVTAQACTIVFDIYPDSVAANQYFFNVRNSADSLNSLIVWTSGSGTGVIRFFVRGTGSFLQVNTAGSTLSASAWQRIVITWDGSDTATNVHIYVDGVEASYALQDDGGSLIDGGGPWAIGGRPSDDLRNFNGRLANFGFYSREASAGEVAQLSDIFSPRTILRGLEWAPDLIRSQRDPITGQAGTLDGTTVIAHPRTIIPAGPTILGLTAIEQITPSGSITPSGVLTNLVIKTITGSIVPSGVLTKQVNRTAFTGSITPSGALANQSNKTFTGSITPSGILVRQSNKILVGSITPSGTLTVQGVNLQLRPARTENLMYIEQVKFTEPYGLELVGGDDKRLETFLRQQKGIETREEAEDTNRTIFYSKDRDIVVTQPRGIKVDGTEIVPSALVPIGGIILWSGSIATIPTNWQLCDGSNGTPDLRNNFVVGAGDTRAVDDTGGQLSIDIQHNHADGTLATDSDAHTHSADGTLATDSDSHSHTADGTLAAASDSHSHGSSPMFLGAPTVTLNVDDNNDGIQSGVAGPSHLHAISGNTDSDAHTHDVTGSTNSDAHSHDVTGNTDSDSHSHDVTGSTANALSTTQDITPLFYALAYIQRLA